MLLSAGKYRFIQIQPQTPMIEKLDTCTSLSRKLRYPEIHGRPKTPHWCTKSTLGIQHKLHFFLKIKYLLLELNTLILLSTLYKNNLTMVSLFQNIWSLVSCQKMCVPKHVQVELSVGVLNVWLYSYSFQPVIHNTIKPWGYMNFLWTKRITKRSKMSSMQKKCHQGYYVNLLIPGYLSFSLKIHTRNWWNKHAINGFSWLISNQYISNISNIYNSN